MWKPALALLSALLLGCPTVTPSEEPTPEPPPQPGAFQSGAAVTRMPVPLGIGTAGSSPIGGPSSDSPYANRFPATRRLHGHPDVRAVVYSRGEGFELVLARVDMIGVVEQLRDAVLLEIRERSGRDLDDALVLSATHTHSGPGRFIEGSFYSLITDEFFPAHYERTVNAIADTILAAYDDLAPAELALVHASAPDGHDDRRCEDGLDYSNDDTPILLARKDGVIESAVISYAIHGTVIGIDDLTMSKDVSGAIEEFTEARLAAPGAMVMLMNSWAADQSPGTPDVAPPPNATPLPDGYDKLERVASYMGDVVSTAALDAEFSATPELGGQTYRYAVDRSAIGYELGEFPYAFGGVYCQGGNDCVTIETIPGLDSACVPFPEDSPAPLQSMVTVGKVAGAHFMTWGGECGTLLAERTMDELRAVDGVQDVLFFGYANDYMGYSLTEEDWWYGGYEASGSMWGPKQGEHMARRAVQSFANYQSQVALAYDEVPPVPLFDLSVVPPVTPEPALELGTIVTQPQDTAADGLVSLAFYGDDPWLGAPIAVLQGQVFETWEDIAAPGGDLFDSDGYGMWVDLAYDPPYDDDAPDPVARHFLWTINMPATSRARAIANLGAGSYRFRVIVPRAGQEPLELLSDGFTIQ